MTKRKPTTAPPPATAARLPRQFRLLPLALILVAGVVAYHNSFTGPFIYDDTTSICSNPHIRHLWPLSEALKAPDQATVAGRPVASFSLAVNYALGGLNVWGYHAFNLALHLLATLTLCGVVRRTFLGERLRERFGGGAEGLALTVALIWMVHPLQTESVAYVIQRTEVLMGLFLLLTLYCLLRGVDSSNRRRWYAAAVVACALGMGSKEVMVAAPLVVLLYDYVFLASSFRDLWRQRWSLYSGLAGTWGVLAILVITTPHQMTGVGIENVTAWDYLKTEAGVIFHYLRLCFWPNPLVIDYFDWPIASSLNSVLVYATGVTVLLVATLWALLYCSPLGFLGAWFFLILGPTSSFLPSVGEAAAERRMYLPLAAVVALVVTSGYEGIAWAARHAGVTEKQQRCVACGLVGVIVVALGWLTVQRNEDYRTGVSIWADAVTKRPQNARAHNNLGSCLQAGGRDPDAIRHYEWALRLKPDYAPAEYNLGLLLWQAGRVQEAVRHWEQALRTDPHLAGAHYTLGVALMQAGKTNEAMQHWEETMRLDPDDAEAQNDLGSALVLAGRMQEAIRIYERALRLKPDYAEAHFNLGLALERVGRLQEAIAHYKQAARIKPGSDVAQNAQARARAIQ